MILSITVKQITFKNGNLIYVIRNVSLTFGFKKLLESVLRFVTDVVLNILLCSADFTPVDGPTMLEVSRKLHLSINLRVFE